METGVQNLLFKASMEGVQPEAVKVLDLTSFATVMDTINMDLDLRRAARVRITASGLVFIIQVDVKLKQQRKLSIESQMSGA